MRRRSKDGSLDLPDVNIGSVVLQLCAHSDSLRSFITSHRNNRILARFRPNISTALTLTYTSPHHSPHTFKLRNARPLPQIPDSHCAILASGTHQRGVPVKDLESREVPMARLQAPQRTLLEAGWVVECELLVAGYGGEAGGCAVNVEDVCVTAKAVA